MISVDPLIVETQIGPLPAHYTRLEDFYVRNHFQAPAPAGVGSLAIEGGLGFQYFNIYINLLIQILYIYVNIHLFLYTDRIVKGKLYYAFALDN